MLVVGWYSSGHLGIDTDTEKMLSQDLPFLQAYSDYKKHFPQFVDTIVIVVEGQSPTAAMRAADKLATGLKTHTDLFKTVFQPGGGPFFEDNGLLYLEVEDLQELADTISQMQPFLGRLTRAPNLEGLFGMLHDALDARARGMKFDLGVVLGKMAQTIDAAIDGRDQPLPWEQMMQGDLSSPQGNRSIIMAQPRLDFSVLLPGEEAMNAVRQVATQLNLDKAHGVRVRMTGEVALATEELQSIAAGTWLSGVLILVSVIAVLYIALRSAWQVAAVLACLVMGLVYTAGFAAVAIGSLNMISVAFVVLYIGLGLAYSIYVCLRFQELTRHGRPRLAAMRITAEDLGVSLLLCAATTALGFYAFIPTAFSGVSELGAISGTSMFISLIINLTVLPAMLMVMPARKRRPRHLPVFYAHRALDVPLRYPGWVLGAAGLLALGSAFLLPYVRFDYNPLNLRDPHTDSVATIEDLAANTYPPPWQVTVLAPDRQAAKNLAAKLSTLAPVELVITLDDFIPQDQDEKLEIMDQMSLMLGPIDMGSSQAADLPIAQRVRAVDDFVQALNQAMLSMNPKEATSYRALRDRLTALIEALKPQPPTEQGRLLDRVRDNLLGPLPRTLNWLQNSLAASPVTRADLPESLVRQWVAADGTWRLAVFPKGDIRDADVLRDFVLAVRTVAPAATDAPVLFLEAGNAIVTAFKQAIGYALIAIATILLLLMRSVRDAILTLIPILLAGLLTAAGTVVANVPFNFANVIALPLLLGAGVDNGIHIVHRVRRANHVRINPLRTSTARAVLYSTLATLCGFGNLWLSSHPGTASMGEMLTLGIILTLVCNLVVLPSLLAVFSEAGADSKACQPLPEPRT